MKHNTQYTVIARLKGSEHIIASDPVTFSNANTKTKEIVIESLSANSVKATYSEDLQYKLDKDSTTYQDSSEFAIAPATEYTMTVKYDVQGDFYCTDTESITFTSNAPVPPSNVISFNFVNETITFDETLYEVSSTKPSTSITNMSTGGSVKD